MPHHASPDPSRPAGAPEPPGPDTPLEDALTRVISPVPWWRRVLAGQLAPVADPPAAGPGARGVFPVVATLGVVMMLSLLGIASPWNAATAPARGGGGTIQDGPVLLDPAQARDPDLPPGRTGARETSPEPVAPPGGSCPAPLSVVATPEVATAVRELAGALAGGDCPRVRVGAEEPAATLRRLTNAGGSPDVWIPASTLWLRLAASGDGADLPTSGTSIARTPVVLAVPDPVADQLASEGAWPVWLVFYDQVTSGAIPRMSMASQDTTAGALARVAFAAAADYHWGDDRDGATFLHTIHFRDSLAATDADPAALLERLATTPPSRSDTQVGVFPVTEQQLRASPGPAVPYGTCEALAEADYPLAISQTLDDRLAAVADELRAQLRSPAAVQRFTAAGFHPPRDRSNRPFLPESICSNDPDPVAIPSAEGWQRIVDGWSWNR